MMKKQYIFCKPLKIQHFIFISPLDLKRG